MSWVAQAPGQSSTVRRQKSYRRDGRHNFASPFTLTKLAITDVQTRFGGLRRSQPPVAEGPWIAASAGQRARMQAESIASREEGVDDAANEVGQAASLASAVSRAKARWPDFEAQGGTL